MVDSPASPANGIADDELVAKLLGRKPMGPYEIMLRRNDGSPVVLRNGAWLDDGRPMPTRYWLADRDLVKAIGQLESTGAISRVEAELGLEVIAQTHESYQKERDELIPAGHTGPAPSGGVGGTRVGVKCLHAHYANYLAGAPDVVGQWVQKQLVSVGRAFDPTKPGIASATDG